MIKTADEKCGPSPYTDELMMNFTQRRRTWRRNLPRLRCVYAGLLLAVLATGCANGPPPTPQAEQAANDSADTQPLERMVRQGRYLDAALAYSRLASRVESPRREEYSLRAAELLKTGNYIPQSFQLLNEIQGRDLGPAFHIRRVLLTADIALARQLPGKALSVLDSISDQLAADERDFRRRYHQLRAQAFEQQADPLHSVNERVQLESLLDDADARQQNQTAILAALSQLSAQTLNQQIADLPANITRGWLALASIGKAMNDNGQTNDIIEQWRMQYPGHPASDESIAALLAARPLALHRAEHIALILPLDTGSRFVRAAEAVRNGFLAAYYAQMAATNSANEPLTNDHSPQPPEPINTDDSLTALPAFDAQHERPINPQATAAGMPTLRIYSEGRSPAAFAASYQRAVDEGADFIVGPLGKSAVDWLAAQESLAIPALALNYSDINHDKPSHKLFQLGLSPEQEARAVAERARLDGHSRAAVITPSSPWGDRVAKAFNERWLELDGHIVEVQHYDPKKNDYSLPIRRLLNVDESQARWKSVRRIIGEKIEFIPRRRQDIDFIFMAAYSRQARVIRPQLRFHHAPKIPVYTTSHAFSGHIDPQMDRDMDGVMFADMPWTLRPDAAGQQLKDDIAQAWPAASKRYTRLYALGVDAYRVIGQLNALRRNPAEQFAGETGALSLDRANQLQRQLLWARFQRGVPKLLDSEPAAETRDRQGS